MQEFRSQRIQEFGDFAGEKLVFGFSEKTLLPYSATPATSDFLTPLLDPCQGWELKGTESPEVNKPPVLVRMYLHCRHRLVIGCNIRDSV